MRVLLRFKAKFHEDNSFILFVVYTGIGENGKMVVVEAYLGIIIFRTINEDGDGDGGKYKFSWWSEECVYTGKCLKWRGFWCKMASCFDVEISFVADLFIFSF